MENKPLSFDERSRRLLLLWRARPLAWIGVGALAWQLAATPANAEVKTVEAYVVDIQGEDLVIDLPPQSGVKVGSEVGIWRSLTFRHPVTKKEIKDRYRFGVLRITQVMTQTSMTRAKGKLERTPEAGDLVRFSFMVPDAPSSVSDESGDAVVALSSSGPTAIDALLASLRGQAPSARVSAYVAYIQANPETPHRQMLLEEARLLQRRVQRKSISKGSLTVQPPSDRHEGWLEVPRLIQADLGAHFTLQVSRTVKGVLLHHRSNRGNAFETVHLESKPELFYTGQLTPQTLKGKLFEYFVEIVGKDGKAQAVLGTEKRPLRARITHKPIVREPLSHRTTFQLTTDYADFNRLRGNDVAWQTEGKLHLRFNDLGLRAFSSGFGVYRGKGGSVESLDTFNLPPNKVGLTYGYLSAEIGLSERVGMIAKVSVGLGDEGVQGGVQALLRLGSDLETNLTLGGEVLGGVGVRGIVQFEMEPQSRFPVLIRSEVTNQPAGGTSKATPLQGAQLDSDGFPQSPAEGGVTASTLEVDDSGDVGVRGIAQVGYRVTNGLVLSVRTSYQGRNIKHSGPGFGGGVSYSW